jgi:branched-chain amino acid aminotransferase
MQDYLLYNGSFYEAGQPLVTADNRGLRYGDGLFETIKVKNQEICFSNWHCERLFAGMQLLGFEPPAYFTAEHLLSQVNELCKKNTHTNARVRINIFRGNGGLYDPENHFPNCIIQSWPLNSSEYQLNENGLVTGIYHAAKKSIDGFSHLKTNNFLPYLMAAQYARQQQWNDALLLNSNNTVCDASIANIFIVKNGIVYTPALTDGCIAGVMRRYLIQNLSRMSIELREESISTEDLLHADEVFLSNTMQGIRWVKNCATGKYCNKLSTDIYRNLLKDME